MSPRYIIVHRTYDPIVAELLGELLREGGIAARVLGTRSAALVGIGQNALQIHIEVPADQAGEATDFLEDYFSADGEELLQAQGAYDDPPSVEQLGEDQAHEEPEPADDYRSPLLAAGVFVLMFGLGHLYARRGWTALVLAIGQVIAIRTMVTAGVWSEIVVGTTMFSVLLMCELAGAPLAAAAHNRGVRRSTSRQLLIGVAFVASAFGLGQLLGPRVPQPEDSQYFSAPEFIEAS